jgi:hypothetical protein
MPHRNDIDEMWGNWQNQIAPIDPRLQHAQYNDPWHVAQLEMVRRMAHQYDAAMELEDVPEVTRRRVLSMVLLGSPDGLDALHRQMLTKELYEAINLQPPRPIYFNPYSFPFHPDEGFKMGDPSV